MTKTELQAAVMAFSAALTVLRTAAYQLRDLELLAQVHTFSAEGNLIFNALAANAKSPIHTV